MKISIVTPTYNGAAFVTATIASVRAQTVPDWEQIVVDDGSTDDTAAVIRALAADDPRIKVVAKPNGGAASARNAGCERIDPSSEYVAFLDHDDVWRPDALERLLGLLAADPAAVAAHGVACRLDDAGQQTGSILNDERRKVAGRRIVVCGRDEPTTFATLICDCCLPTPGVALVRRSAFERVRLPDGSCFDTGVKVGSDWDFWLRLSLLGRFAFVDDVVLGWRSHGANESRDGARMHEAESLVRRKFANLPGLTSEQREMARWRCRRSFASVERRNAAVCARAARVALAGRRWTEAAHAAGAWLDHTRAYVGWRHGDGPIDAVPNRLTAASFPSTPAAGSV